MKKLHLLQNLASNFSFEENSYAILNNSYSFNESFLLFDLLKAFNEKLLIIFSNIRL
uniref:hypothetical protein n=1 Tax=Flavobacterium sp. TaxID=239 RepID=UPI00404AEAC7